MSSPLGGQKSSIISGPAYQKQCERQIILFATPFTLHKGNQLLSNLSACMASLIILRPKVFFLGEMLREDLSEWIDRAFFGTWFISSGGLLSFWYRQCFWNAIGVLRQ